jgi:predicted SnoaL-like aldol condensation-catalyzing enzyme
MRRILLGAVVATLMLGGCGRQHHNLTPLAERLDAFANAHDLNGITSLLTDDVVIKGPDGSTHVGKDSARAWLEPYLPGFHVESYGWEHAGDTLKWMSTVHSDAFAHMGINPMKLHTMAVFSGERIRYFATAPNQETANKLRFQEFFNTVVNERHIDDVDKFLSDDFVEHQPLPPNAPKGRDGVKSFFRMVTEAFPDLHVTIDLSLGDGDYVFVASTWTGTNKGAFMGRRPTNKSMTWTSGDVVRILDGKATEHWGWDNMAEMMTSGHQK